MTIPSHAFTLSSKGGIYNLRGDHTSGKIYRIHLHFAKETVYKKSDLLIIPENVTQIAVYPTAVFEWREFQGTWFAELKSSHFKKYRKPAKLCRIMFNSLPMLHDNRVWWIIEWLFDVIRLRANFEIVAEVNLFRCGQYDKILFPFKDKSTWKLTWRMEYAFHFLGLEGWEVKIDNICMFSYR